MEVFLDDLRDAPPGWQRTYWPAEVIALLALRSAHSVLSRKSDARTGLANAVMAAGTAAATWYLFRTIRQLATGAPSVTAPEKSHGHITADL